MALLYRILYAAHASGAHHKLALRGLEQMRGAAAEDWRRLFLSEAAALLEGSKAPDKVFKDFQNHCLHPADKPGGAEWGGAPDAAETWYYKTVRALAERKWREAVYNAGVLTHYYTDPLMPFHTGSSKEESEIHRAAEWSVSKSFERLWAAGSPPAPEALGAVDADGDPKTADWVAAMTRAGAAESHRYYRLLIEDYDFKVGAKQPEHGFGEASNDVLADLLAHAAAGVALLLERACADSGATPPPVSLTAKTALAALEIPAKWVLKRIENAEERAAVAAIYAELEATGKVEKNLPEEQRAIRALAGEAVPAPVQRRVVQEVPAGAPASEPEKDAGDAEAPTPAEDASPAGEWLPPISAELQALKEALAPRPAPEDAPAKKIAAPRLLRADPVEKAPSIGPKTAERLAKLGIATVGDLLDGDPKEIARGLDDRRIPAKTVALWRDQARLLTTTPGLKAAEAVMLAAAGYRDVAGLARAEPALLRQQLVVIAKTDKVKRALRGAEAPDLEETTTLIEAAREVVGMGAGRAAYA